MLIEFSVENYLCFKNETTFSFEAMTDLDESKIFNPESRRKLDGVDNPEKVVNPETGEPIVINTVNAIYGKNAAGKSTFLQGLMKIFSLIMRSRKLDDNEDFNLDYYDNEKPVIFKLTFVHEQMFYNYALQLYGENKEAFVQYEMLKNVSLDQTLFIRNNQVITSDGFLTDDQINSLDEDLPKNHLLFSYTFGKLKPLRVTFSQENNDTMDVRQLNRSKHPFAGVRRLSVLDIGLFPERLKDKIESKDWKSDLLKQLKEADFDIIDYEFKLFEEELYDIYFITEGGKKRTFREQSEGTKKFFILLVDIKDNILDNGGMYVVDELEKALHPRLAMRFINIFKNPETNPKNARLLFTSHDVGFMHQSILNGDQVWFIERNDETQETDLFSPAEEEHFSPLRLQSEYMHGMYGAVPNTKWEQ